MDSIQLIPKKTSDSPFSLTKDSQTASADRLPSFFQGSLSKSPSKEQFKNSIITEEKPVDISNSQPPHTFGSRTGAESPENPQGKFIKKEYRASSPSRVSSTKRLETDNSHSHNNQNQSTNITQGADEQKPQRISTTNEPLPAWKPSMNTGSRKSVDRCKTPNTIYLKRPDPTQRNASPTSRKTSPTSRLLTTMDSFASLSPTKRQFRGGSTGIFYENKAANILQTAASTASISIKGKEKETRSPSPGRSLSPSRFDTPLLKDLHTEPSIKKDPKAKLLKDIKLEGKTLGTAQGDAKKGLTIVRVILDGAVDEKAQFKVLINDLKLAIKAEKDYLAQKNENMKLLENGMYQLDKSNNNLGRNTEGNQTLANRATDDVNQMQNELDRLNEELAEMKRQIEIEKNLVKELTIKTKQMKIQSLEQAKERDQLKEEVVEGSRRERNKARERYEEAMNTQNLFLKTIENQFQKFAEED